MLVAQDVDMAMAQSPVAAPDSFLEPTNTVQAPQIEPATRHISSPHPSLDSSYSKLPDHSSEESHLARHSAPPDADNEDDSELSDCDPENPETIPFSKAHPEPAHATDEIPDDDIGEVLPAEWSGKVPIFRPTMRQFQDFKKFMEAVDSYGMKSGIIKIVPPSEWRESLPPIDDLVKQVRVRNPIKQDIMGSSGTYRQVNFVHGRIYNIPQWRNLCDQSEHQPPARRGERRANFDKTRVTSYNAPAPPPRPAKKPQIDSANSTAGKKKRGRPPGRKTRMAAAAAAAAAAAMASTEVEAEAEATEVEATEIEIKAEANEDASNDSSRSRPITPISSKDEEHDDHEQSPEGTESNAGNPSPDQVMTSIERDTSASLPTAVSSRQRGRMNSAVVTAETTQSTSARRKFSKREGSAKIDEEAFKDFDYNMDISEFTPERCEELERIYWKTLTYAQPLYGADLMGTLFDESVERWNLNKLPNLLDVLGTKVPGVNTAYLYLGMWKATFAWHLEDVDLYSINYLHFGAPKQWYSISQADARRFEAAMKTIWPQEAKACDQFLRHKGFLISPQHLKNHFNITVNKVVSYPGEFVVTYPYGYHSGYNLGYNCAEAVNFALDTWLPMGKIAKKCECAEAQDSVWVDVYEIERKLRGEEEVEYEYIEVEVDDEEEEEDDNEDDNDDENENDHIASGIPSPPDSSHGSKATVLLPKKRKKSSTKDPSTQPLKKKMRVQVKVKSKSRVDAVCCLCPNDIRSLAVLPTDDGRTAHRMCARYLSETYIDEAPDGSEVVCGVDAVTKLRHDLKCLFCHSKRGACIQCTQNNCTRVYHASCAAASGAFVEEGQVPVFGPDGTEYKDEAFEFSCRFHRVRRDRSLTGYDLEQNQRTLRAAAALVPGDICQLQFHTKDVFAGVVVENRAEEEILLVESIPNKELIEAQWKWLVVADPADFHLPKASPAAVPMPRSKAARDALKGVRGDGAAPRRDEPFIEGFTWGEFVAYHDVCNPEQKAVDFADEAGRPLWHFLGDESTDSRAQYTRDPCVKVPDSAADFLATIPKPVKPKKPKAPKTIVAPPTYAPGANPAFGPVLAMPQILGVNTNTSQQCAAAVSREQHQPPQPAYLHQPITHTPTSQSFLAAPSQRLQTQNQNQRPAPPTRPVYTYTPATGPRAHFPQQVVFATVQPPTQRQHHFQTQFQTQPRLPYVPPPVIQPIYTQTNFQRPFAPTTIQAPSLQPQAKLQTQTQTPTNTRDLQTQLQSNAPHPGVIRAPAPPSNTPSTPSAPLKQTPVPVPAKYLAAPVSSPALPISTPAPAPNKVSLATTTTCSRVTVALPSPPITTPHPLSKSLKPDTSTPLRVSTTPIPVPRVPGMATDKNSAISDAVMPRSASVSLPTAPSDNDGLAEVPPNSMGLVSEVLYHLRRVGGD
ncbi:DNA damage-responsive transcriptional repressor RPH1 [Ceratocystis lukuohia]|uniref:[histone H3]-trimethyl-L-lysine(9) demethylase n=1 Tax=Ceratocystis lukuohia TaxID=2019550 RepID=A0ABR4MFC7_9PEZI